MGLSFENTENAFSHKSNTELRKAYSLFKVIGWPWMVKMGKGLLNVALAIRFPVAWIIKPTVFQQFCGGESIEECAETTKVLDSQGVGTILDYSVEGKKSEEVFEATCEEILQTIKVGNGNEHIPFCVFKVTGIGRFELLEKVDAGADLSNEEKDEFSRLKHRVDQICKLAFETGTPVFIDAEESWIQDAIDELAEEMMGLYNGQKAIVYTTTQMYRHDRLEYLKRLIEKGKSSSFIAGVKLVRGAYMEKERERASELGYPSPIQKDKASSDRDFDLALQHCVEHIDGVSICAGTHNEESSLRLCELMQESNISNGDKRIYFAQLYGMSDHISFNLSKAGYNVAKYVPYGPIKEVIPYLIRRAQENTSVEGQRGRELTLIVKELKRRKIS